LSPSKDPETYISEYLNEQTKQFLDPDICARICKKIRQAQQDLKSTSLEGKCLSTFSEISRYGHSLTYDQIKSLILNTVFSTDIFKNPNIPDEFRAYISQTPECDIKERFELAQSGIFKAYVVRGLDKEFWDFFKSVCSIYKANKSTSLQTISQMITSNSLKMHPMMDLESSLLFSSYIKGEYYEN
jgi:hypothetical protein